MAESRLIKLRDQLLEMTQAIDKQMEERLLQARKNLNTIVQVQRYQGNDGTKFGYGG